MLSLHAAPNSWNLKQMSGHFLIRGLPLCLLILFLERASPGWSDRVLAGAIAENLSSSSYSALGSSADTTWSQGLALGVNGPIPVIVVDQFGYPTKASKIAVIRDPREGYDNAAHFTPGQYLRRLSISLPGRLQNRARQFLGMTALRTAPQATRSGGLISRMSQLPGTYAVVDLDKGLRSPEFRDR